MDERMCGAAREAISGDDCPNGSGRYWPSWTEPTRRRMVLLDDVAALAGGRSGKPPPWMTDEDLARLRGRLSLETRKQLEAPAAVQTVATGGRLDSPRMRHPGRGMHGPLPRPTTNAWPSSSRSELSDDERDQLLGLPGEEMQRRLQQMYLMPHPAAGRAGTPSRWSQPGPMARRRAADAKEAWQYAATFGTKVEGIVTQTIGFRRRLLSSHCKESKMKIAAGGSRRLMALPLLCRLAPMPCYLFTLHAYRSWNADHPRGFVREQGRIEPPNPKLARFYDRNAKQPPVRFRRFTSA